MTHMIAPVELTDLELDAIAGGQQDIALDRVTQRAQAEGALIAAAVVANVQIPIQVEVSDVAVAVLGDAIVGS